MPSKRGAGGKGAASGVTTAPDNPCTPAKRATPLHQHTCGVSEMTMKTAITCSKCDNRIDSPHAADGQTMKGGEAVDQAVCADCAPFHCLTCKDRTSSLNPEIYAMANGHKGSRGICAICGRKKNRIGALAGLVTA